MVPVVLLGYLGARDNTSHLLGSRSELVLDVVVDRVAAHLGPVLTQLAYVGEAVRRGALDPQDDLAMRAYIAGSLAAAPQVNSISFVRPDLTVRRHDRTGHASYEETPDMLSAVQQSIANERIRFGPALGGTALESLSP